ncbi:hypothetical protein SBBP2_1180002 [Burkholderiales bacterium]|nr:hypothetical protein SBBP2_1180002 [Burkholderiales bacterium]
MIETTEDAKRTGGQIGPGFAAPVSSESGLTRRKHVRIGALRNRRRGPRINERSGGAAEASALTRFLRITTDAASGVKRSELHPVHRCMLAVRKVDPTRSGGRSCPLGRCAGGRRRR